MAQDHVHEPTVTLQAANIQNQVSCSILVHPVRHIGNNTVMLVDPEAACAHDQEIQEKVVKRLLHIPRTCFHETSNIIFAL